MMSSLFLGLPTFAISVAFLPAITPESNDDDLGVRSISLKDVIKPIFCFQGALQGAGTPYQVAIKWWTLTCLCYRKKHHYEQG